MKKSELRKIIREEYTNAIKEITPLPPAPKPDNQAGKERGSYDVTSKYIEKPQQMVKTSKHHIFKPETGDKIEFDINDVKDTNGEIAGYSPAGDVMYIQTSAGHYIKVNLVTESTLIKKITLESGTSIIPPVTI